MKRIIISIFISIGASILFFGVPQAAHAAPNIDDTEPNHWAWNDAVGWIDFLYGNNIQVEAAADRLRGYASSSIGFFAFDCNTAPTPNCTSPAWFVSSEVETTGSVITAVKLAGWAWNDAVGWVSFCGNDTEGSTWNGSTWECPPNPTYQVQISPSGSTEGEFSGWAWNDAIGWISFNASNCDTDANGFLDVACGGNNSSTPVVAYRVKLKIFQAGNLISPVYDLCPSGVTCGAGLNYVLWQGDEGGLPGSVRFQIATDCSVGAPPSCPIANWVFLGSDGTASTYYTSVPDNIMNIRMAFHNNKRYVRYKVFLTPCNMSLGCYPPNTPRVDDVIINWSP
jgi:hypothetical protein